MAAAAGKCAVGLLEGLAEEVSLPASLEQRCNVCLECTREPHFSDTWLRAHWVGTCRYAAQDRHDGAAAVLELLALALSPAEAAPMAAALARCRPPHLTRLLGTPRDCAAAPVCAMRGRGWHAGQVCDAGPGRPLIPFGRTGSAAGRGEAPVAPVAGRVESSARRSRNVCCDSETSAATRRRLLRLGDVCCDSETSAATRSARLGAAD
jgi:hypothetical protein